jgi:hypothetical protein
MPAKSQKSTGSWWATLPGILTGIGGIIGAIAALIVALNTIGWFDRKPPASTPAPVSAPSKSTPDVPSKSTPSAPSKGLPEVNQRNISNLPQRTWPLPLTADNVAAKVREGAWNWTIFIQGTDDALDQIRCVEYTLHPSFPDPVVTVCQKGAASRAFALSGSGWGTFEVGIRVIAHDGREQKLKYHLRF